MTDNHTEYPKVKNLKLAGNVFLRTFFSAVLNIILYFSLLTMASFLVTKPLTQIYQKGDDGSFTLVTEYLTSGSSTSNPESSVSDSDSGTSQVSSENSEETSIAADDTQTTSDTGLVKMQSRTNMSVSAVFLTHLLCLVLMMILFIAMPYSKLWDLGDKDSNSVNFGHMAEDKLRGLKIGLIAGIPSYLFYVLLLIAKIGKILPYYFSAYRLLNASFVPVIYLVNPGIFNQPEFPKSADASWMLLFVFLITTAVLPFICYLAYQLGYKHISITEKIIYVDPKKRKKRRRY